jgi:hypothetical protein
MPALATSRIFDPGNSSMALRMVASLEKKKPLQRHRMLRAQRPRF